MDAVDTIMRAATRTPGRRLNVLSAAAHERAQSPFAGVNATFWLARGQQHVKRWNPTYAPLPDNHVELPEGTDDDPKAPPDVVFDVVLSHHRFGMTQIMRRWAARYHLPLVVIEHTFPRPDWSPDYLKQVKQVRGDVSVFISSASRTAWGYTPDEAVVVEHGLDSDTFRPTAPPSARPNVVLTVANDFVNRAYCLGYDLFREATRGLPVMVVGATPGLSEPARDIPELVGKYNQAGIYLCPATSSPIPMSLLESMACGCAVVAVSQGLVPEVVRDGETGLLVPPDAVAMRKALDRLMGDSALKDRLGAAARAEVMRRFSLGRFRSEWETVLRAAAEIPFTGTFGGQT